MVIIRIIELLMFLEFITKAKWLNKFFILGSNGCKIAESLTTISVFESHLQLKALDIL